MSTMTRFIIRAVPALAGFMVGTIVMAVIVSELGLYGVLATTITIAAGLGVGYLGFRIGRGIAARREEGAYMDGGYPPQEHDQMYQQPHDQQGYGYQSQGHPQQSYGQYPPYQG